MSGSRKRTFPAVSWSAGRPDDSSARGVHLSLAHSTLDRDHRRRYCARATREHHQHRQRHHGVVLEEDPVYKDYERYRAEFGGTRALIVALEADSAERLFSKDTLAFIERVTGDIERVGTVHRVASLATATIVEALPPSGQQSDPDSDDGGLEVRPLLENLSARDPAEIRRKALKDDLIRGDLVSDDGRVAALVVTFRRRPDRRGARGHHPGDPSDRRSRAPARHSRALQRQPGDQRDLQPNHAGQSEEVHAADSADHSPGHLPEFPLDPQDAPVAAGDRRQRSLDARARTRSWAFPSTS